MDAKDRSEGDVGKRNLDSKATAWIATGTKYVMTRYVFRKLHEEKVESKQNHRTELL